MRLAHRSFSFADQMHFASISGDRNPMHVDAVRARRTQAGAPVVHGAHLLLWALESLAATQTELPPLRGLRAHFNKFVYLDETVELVLAEQRTARVRLNLLVDKVPRSKVTIELGDWSEDLPAWSRTLPNLQDFLLEPLAPGFEDIAGQSGRLPSATTANDAEGMFPAATHWLGAPRIAALATSSYLVGMVCPGLHSIYSELRLRTCTASDVSDAFTFRVAETDPRFRSVQIEVAGGGWIGTVESTARMPPVPQATMESLLGVVGADEFAGGVALVVGGSRGLGELTAKLLATGGGRVFITWQSGEHDAERVAQEIRSAGGACETLHYDARRPAAEQLMSLRSTPTHAYYFATQPIFRPGATLFSRSRLEEFLAIYAEGFWQLSQALYACQPEVSIFYPSSVFVSERPEGMTEYAMAKAAGEVLCADMRTSMKRLRVIVARLPRLLTDQTASAIAAETGSALKVMLPVVREVQLGTR